MFYLANNTRPWPYLTNQNWTFHISLVYSVAKISNIIFCKPGQTGADPGFGVRGAKLGEGSGNHLGPQSGQGRSPGGGPGGEAPASSCN